MGALQPHRPPFRPCSSSLCPERQEQRELVEWPVPPAASAFAFFLRADLDSPVTGVGFCTAEDAMVWF